MESPDSTDAVSYAAILKTLGDLMPGMPAPARSRAAWKVARAKLNLADAVRAEGFDLHASAAPARASAPASAPVAPLRAVASHGSPPPPTVTAEAASHLRLAGRIMAAGSPREKAAIIAQAESWRVSDEARALQERDPKRFSTYRAALEYVTRRTA